MLVNPTHSQLLLGMFIVLQGQNRHSRTATAEQRLLFLKAIIQNSITLNQKVTTFSFLFVLKNHKNIFILRTLAITLLGAGRAFLSCTEEPLLNEDSKTSEAALDLSETGSSDDPMLFESLCVEILACFPDPGCKFQHNILKATSVSRSDYKAFYTNFFF